MQRLLVLKWDASKVAPATLASSGLTNHFAQLFVFKESGLWHTAAEGIFWETNMRLIFGCFTLISVSA